ncbi:MAG: 3-ketoacyl-ACP reductase [Bacteroidota bacterium]|nr:3-ketoacyl-ACP reductase [Bacteroidota bacterium]
MKQTALITGGSRGIGLGIAMELAGKGINLAINGIRPEQEVEDVLETLRGQGAKVIYCQGDISKQTDRNSVLEKIRKEFGQLNFLVNNAGVAPKERKDLLEAGEESFEHVLRTNLQGPYFLSQGAANWLVKQKKEDANFFAAIINISSVSATMASVNRGEYCVSKAGMAMMTKLFASRLGEFDIPVYEVRPGVIETDMTAAVKEKYDKLFREGLAVQSRWGQPSDVGKIVLALVSGMLPYSTGEVIMADGGLSISRL